MGYPMGDIDSLRRDTRRVIQAQMLITVLIGVGFGAVHDLAEALAALYGGAITILITAWLARRVRQAGQVGSPGAGLVVIYSSAAVRYAAVVLLVGAGIGLLNLSPVPLLCAFAATQFGFLVNILRSKRVAGPVR